MIKNLLTEKKAVELSLKMRYGDALNVLCDVMLIHPICNAIVLELFTIIRLQNFE
jgi:hypothetical protein